MVRELRAFFVSEVQKRTLGTGVTWSSFSGGLADTDRRHGRDSAALSG